MPYPLLRLEQHVPPSVVRIVRKCFEPSLKEIHGLMTIGGMEHGRIVVFSIATATLLLTQMDGAATLLGPPTRFDAFVLRYYPWDADPPTPPFDRRSVSDLLYLTYRNPFVHNARVRIRGDRSTVQKVKLILKSPAGIDALATAPRPIRPLLKTTPQKTIVNLDTLYWGLRRMIETALSDERRCAQIDLRLRSQGLIF